MESIELVASSVDEARDKAALQLGVDAKDVEIEVLEEAKGLFGKPGKVTVKASAKAAKAEKPKKAPAKKAKEEVAEESSVEEVKEEKPKKAPAKSAAKPKKTEAKKEESSDSGEKEEREEAEATQDDADMLVNMLNSVFEAGDLDASVSCSELNGRYVNLEISGQDVGFLVGRRGEVLNAIQYYMNVVAARKLHNGVRVTLEGDNYREKRATSLSNMAQEIAAEVVKRGQEAVLDPLPAFERRIIHQALSEIEGISTYSEGEEPNRRIVIAPGEGAKNSDD